MPASESSWLAHFGVFAMMAVVPFLVVVCTSFAKVSVVLSITKNAIGGQGVIPLSVVTALSFVVTIFIMGPVVDRMMDAQLPVRTAVKKVGNQSRSVTNSPTDSKIFSDAAAVYTAVSPPLIEFLRENTPEDEIQFFSKLDKSGAKKSNSIRILLVAFASNELIEAFVLGFLVLIPFLLVDLIAANTLGALGLANISVITVSLPLKLLLFITADGWHLVVNALIMSYGTQ